MKVPNLRKRAENQSEGFFNVVIPTAEKNAKYKLATKVL